MQALSTRVATDQTKQWEDCARRLADEQGIAQIGLPPLVQAINELTVVELGHLRSSWLLHDKPYMPADEGTAQACLSDLLLAISAVCETLCAQITVSPNGLLSLNFAQEHELAVVCVHGSGVKSWRSVLTRLEQRWAGPGRLTPTSPGGARWRRHYLRYGAA